MTKETNYDSSASNDVLDGQCADYLVVGSDLNGSLMAAKLAQQGQRVLLVEPSAQYGGTVHSTVSNMKGFALDTTPILIWANSQLARDLVELGVGDHLDLVKLARITVVTGDTLRMVPRGKEDIFMDPTLTFPHKRMLWKALTGVFEAEGSIQGWLKNAGLPDDLINMIMYGVCLAKDEADATSLTIDNARQRFESFLSAAHLYSMSTPWLYPVHGTSEICQLLCRRAAIHGATILMKTSIRLDDGVVSGQLVDGLRWHAQFKHCRESYQYPLEAYRWTGICSGAGIYGETSTCLFIIIRTGPPLYILQLASDTACAPPDHMVLHAWSEQPFDSPFVDLIWQSSQQLGPRPLLR